MDKINIEGVLLTPLMKISHSKGDVYHAMKKSDNGYAGFGEVYFSTIKSGEIKGWNKHKKMILNLVVPIGKITFVIYDDREKSRSNGNFYTVTLSPSNYQRLTIQSGLWIAFKGKGNNTSFMLNMANMEHDSNEVLHKSAFEFTFDWSVK